MRRIENISRAAIAEHAVERLVDHGVETARTDDGGDQRNGEYGPPEPHAACRSSAQFASSSVSHETTLPAAIAARRR